MAQLETTDSAAMLVPDHQRESRGPEMPKSATELARIVDACYRSAAEQCEVRLTT